MKFPFQVLLLKLVALVLLVDIIQCSSVNPNGDSNDKQPSQVQLPNSPQTGTQLQQLQHQLNGECRFFLEIF